MSINTNVRGLLRAPLLVIEPDCASTSISPDFAELLARARLIP
jgi:hypothetical protein